MSSLFRSLKVTVASCGHIVVMVKALPSSHALRSVAAYKGERQVLSVRVELLFLLRLQYLQLSLCRTPGSSEYGRHARGTDRLLVSEKDRSVSCRAA